MQGKIVLEEHIAVPETAENPRGIFTPDAWAQLRGRLLDIHGERLREMDAHGIEMMVLSLNSPAVQAVLDPREAAAMAQRANDLLAAEVQKRPDRFQGFAALPMQDPELAAAELQRCVKDLGFRGAMVNGFSQVGEPDNAVYYDQPQYRPFWAAVERLGVPFYLHPRSALSRDARLYAGHSWLMGAAWGYGNETAVHALRLIGCGLFDEFPRLTVVIGHMGEGIPFNLWRLDNCNAGVEKATHNQAKRKAADYFSENFYVTTSGNFSNSALIATLLEVGADRVMFSVDWPFELIEPAVRWFDEAPIGANDRRKIGRDNALRVLKLKSG